jgi:folate-binding protein YgfZ
MLPLKGYRAASERVALSDQSARLRLEVTGPERAKFLHNLTTNEVKRLPAGRGCEAFVTSPQGKILALVKLLVCADSILVSTDPGGMSLALPHFQKYGVFDEIGLEDRSETTFELHLAGPIGDELLRRCGGATPEPEALAQVATSLAESPVLVWRDAPTGRPGLTLIGPRAAAGKISGLLKARGVDLGLEELDPAAFEVLRIEAGMPVFGRDLTEKNLPQESGRDDRAINFVKGCYLGQETVARIDALGHVNQLLKGLRGAPDDPVPPPGSPLEFDRKRVGLVTSSAFSPGWNAPIALGLIRTSHCAAGTRLVLRSGGDPGSEDFAVVGDLPMLPPAG